jgi:hypothetical protein
MALVGHSEGDSGGNGSWGSRIFSGRFFARIPGEVSYNGIIAN